MLKICNNCKEEKLIECFGKHVSSSDGLRKICKACRKIQSAIYRNNNREKLKFKRISKSKEAKEKDKLSKKKYVKNNKDKVKESNKKWREENKKYVKEYQKQYSKNKRKNDPIYKLISNRRRRRLEYLKKNKNSVCLSDLGCSAEKWHNYLESKFDENMNWDNQGNYWHIDEIIPCTAWDQTNEIERKACWHYLNSQPLEANANIKKGGSNRKDYTQEKIEFINKLKELAII